MGFRKALFLIILCLTFTGLVFAYTGSATGDGPSDSVGSPTGGNTDVINGGDINCYDGDDNDQYNGADADDQFSCVLPLKSDHIEGSIWDTDLTTVMDGEAPPLSATPSVFFSGSLERGNDNEERSENDNGSLTEYYVIGSQSESDGYYAYGLIGSISYSGFPSGTEIQNRRAIDPPNRLDGGSCGDGIENEGITKTGDDGGVSSTNNCKEDYGDIAAKYYVRSPYQRDGLDCEKDEAKCETVTNICECTAGSCGGKSCSAASCDANVDVQCWVTEDNSDDEANTYYLEWSLDARGP